MISYLHRFIFILAALVSGCGSSAFKTVADPGDDSSTGDTGDTGTNDVAMQNSDANDSTVPDDGGDGGDGADPSDGGATFRRVFITSQTYDSNFGGLIAADAICQSTATAASLGGSWMAWLSTVTTSAASRLEHATVPYQLLNGESIAADWTDLTSGSIRHPIDHDEHDNIIIPVMSSYSTVWTGTQTDGTSYSGTWATCDDWTYSSPTAPAYNGEVGQLVYGEDGGATSIYWTSAGGTFCWPKAASSFYCIEQF